MATTTAHAHGSSRTLRRTWQVTKRTVRRLLRTQAPDRAAALAYYAFMAIPAVMLIVVGTYGSVASVDDVATLMDRMGSVAPQEVTSFLGGSLRRIVEASATGPILIVVGFLVALWTASGAMAALIRALNAVYGLRETRGALRQRLVALALLGLVLGSAVLVLVVLVAGPLITGWIADATGASTVVNALWWTLQWPLLIIALLAAFAAILRLGPDHERPVSRLLAPGGIAAVALWLIISSGFALYVGLSGTYQRTWGPIASVVVMLVWLWLSGLALLIGAAVDSEWPLAGKQLDDAGDGDRHQGTHDPE